jgi:signal transduction histidine kinase
VSALLVEARADRRTLTRDDFEDVRTLVEPGVNRRGGPLAWHVTLDAETSLPATPVRQLLLNLVLNALSAAGEGGRAVVHVTASDARLRMLVENTGTPLPPERLDYLFEPFPSSRRDGEGLGLWVCYQIVSQLHGRIDVEAVGVATRVRVDLPLHPEIER